ncbi:unnamed protein product [Meloidogyne enterolobii]|uniref:Uncharacterized protein n=1 Tax=Meloidogyne enterolobii TaxID=390850 RepID=A0ACB0Y8R9_MELEN
MKHIKLLILIIVFILIIGVSAKRRGFPTRANCPRGSMVYEPGGCCVFADGTRNCG